VTATAVRLIDLGLFRLGGEKYAELDHHYGAATLEKSHVSVRRDDRPNSQIDESNAPADVSIQVYSQGNIVSNESGLLATLRRTLAQSAGAIMWSLRMIGVAVAFLAPWAIALIALIWITKRVIRARQSRP